MQKRCQENIREHITQANRENEALRWQHQPCIPHTPVHTGGFPRPGSSSSCARWISGLLAVVLCVTNLRHVTCWVNSQVSLDLCK